MTGDSIGMVAKRSLGDVVVFLILLLVLAAAPQQSLAQNGVPMGDLMCYFGPNQYLPCGSPPPHYDPLQSSLARYAAVLTRLQAYPRIRLESYEPSTAGTPEELSQQADSLFFSTAYQLDGLALHSKSLARRTKENESLLETLYARERDLKARGEALPAALLKANADLGRALAQAEAEERLVSSIEAVADRMQARADAAATESMQWLTVASPPGVPLVTAKMVAGRTRPKREPLELVRPEMSAVPASIMPISLNPESGPMFRQTPAGTPDEKIAATEALIPQIAAVSAEYEERAMLYGKLAAVLKKVTPRVKALQTEVDGGERGVGAVETLTSRAGSRTGTAFTNRYIAGANAAQAIGEAYILEAFRDNVVKPEVIAFLRANGIKQKIDNNLVMRLYTERKSLLPPVAPEQWAALGRLVDVEKRTIRLLGDLETYLYAAIESISDPNDRNGAVLVEEMRAGTNTAVREIIEKAAGDPGPLYKIAHAMFGRR